MISANSYCVTCHLKIAQVFAILIRDIQYQVEKKAKAKTNTKSVITQEYHNFLAIFSTKDLDTFLLN